MEKCPRGLLPILFEMLKQGNLAVRAHCWANRVNLGAAEADHIHNLADLIWDFSWARLDYYWIVERPSFADAVPAECLQAWTSLWDRLRPYAESHEIPEAGSENIVL